MPSVSSIDVFSAELPFRFSFGHALATRRSTTNVYARVTLSDGSVGYGEGVPRGYVTGETHAGALEALQQRYAPALAGRALSDVDALLQVLAAVADADEESFSPGAFCALELASLDAAGRSFGRSIADWLADRRPAVIAYDAVLPFMPYGALAGLLIAARAAGLSTFKLKVGRGMDADLRALALVRRIVGMEADVRVDANCAWTAEEAMAAIDGMRRYRLSAVEQPVAADDLDGLRRVTAAVPETIVADESVCSPADAERLVRHSACDALNIRVSKCGGLSRALRVAEIARAAGLELVVGAQVGESGLLSAAGRHLAAAVRPRYAEGSAGSLLLKQDLVTESVLPGRGGLARVHDGPGLGVTVREASLARYGRLHSTITPSFAEVR
jgi:L-alanine-DL-glutamate epimerase-like enolase superfamily enzyme